VFLVENSQSISLGLVKLLQLLSIGGVLLLDFLSCPLQSGLVHANSGVKLILVLVLELRLGNSVRFFLFVSLFRSKLKLLTNFSLLIGQKTLVPFIKLVHV